MIKKKAVLTALAACLAIAPLAHGGQKIESLIPGEWDRQERSIEGMMSTWKKGGTNKDYADSLVDLMVAETNLIACGVSPRDKRLVSHLFSKDHSPKPSLDAYRVFLARFSRQTGWVPSRDELYSNKKFTIVSKNNSSLTFEVELDEHTQGENR